MNLQEQIKNLTTKTEFTADDRKVFEVFKTISQDDISFSDLISLALHCAVAERLRLNPKLIQKAKVNLDNWLRRNPDEQVWLEWKKILENESMENIIKIITAETDEGQRLRSSSPFAGLVTIKERKEIIELCEKA